MFVTIPRAEVRALLLRQLMSFFSVHDSEVAEIDASFDMAFERYELSFSHVRNKYYRIDGITCFNPLHSCQWTAFLYFLSNSIFHSGGGAICDKIYFLLKVISSADLYYQVELPKVFFFDHPMAAVIGRGRYSDYFTFGQGCTVGNNHGVYPRFGESVFMLSDSKVIGNTVIGDYVIIGAGSYVKDENIPTGSLVFGQSPNLVVKTDRLDYVRGFGEGVFCYE